MRIVGGAFKGAHLVTPKGRHTRPTSDRVRESLFNILAHSFDGFALEEVQVLDLFAGSGGLAFEALSRGAACALLVDNDAKARGAQRENIEVLGFEGRARLFRRDATKLGPAKNMGPFGLLFLDPPYGKELAQKALVAALDGGWLQSGAICVIEEEARAELALPDLFAPLDERIYGGTKITFLRYKG